MAGNPIQPTPLSPLPASDTNVEQTKYFTFNETGNIMISTTATNTDQIQQDVRNVFNEVSVFFAAMTKAMTNTIIPGSNPPVNYSLYDYDALEKVIGGSGVFIHMTEEDITYSSESFGMNFSKDLITALLGLASGAGELSFASGLIASIGQAGLTISQSSTSNSGKVANIVFVCEYLLGIPLVSAIVVYVDSEEVTQAFQVGPCFKESSTSITMNLHKDVYLFVSPTFIKQYAADLDSIIDNTDYNEFVQFLEDLLTGLAMIVSITDSLNNNAPANLVGTTQYIINGAGFGDVKGVLTLGPIQLSGGNPTNELNAGTWGQNLITFTGWANGSGAQNTSPAAIYMYAADKTTLLATSTSLYTMIPGQVTSIQDSNGRNAKVALSKTMTYTIQGSGFGTTAGIVSLGPYNATAKNSLDTSGWSDSSISFMGMGAGSTAPTVAAPIYIYAPGAAGAAGELLAVWNILYTMGN